MPLKITITTEDDHELEHFTVLSPDMMRVELAARDLRSVITSFYPSSPHQPQDSAVVGLLRAMDDADRHDLFNGYCLACGSDDPGCVCWNDE